jgi:hypothetical protein
VRTVRLVGVAVARRAGVADDQLDEVRLAIGEACARAVARHQRLGIRDTVQVSFTDGDRYLVKVIDRAVDVEQLDGEDQLTIDVSVALLQGLVKDLRMSPLDQGPGTEVRMGWPVKRRSR